MRATLLLKTTPVYRIHIYLPVITTSSSCQFHPLPALFLFVVVVLLLMFFFLCGNYFLFCCCFRSYDFLCHSASFQNELIYYSFYLFIHLFVYLFIYLLVDGMRAERGGRTVSVRVPPPPFFYNVNRVYHFYTCLFACSSLHIFKYNV